MSPGYLVKSVINRVAPSRFLLHRHTCQDNTLALTFDDGPHPQHTPLLIDILETAGIKATFFVQGSEAKKYPRLIRDLAESGHQIANHGYHHLDCHRVSSREYIADVESAQSLLQDIAGESITRTFRPPYGNVTTNTFLRLNQMGYKYAFWSADSRDSFILNREELLHHIYTLPVRAGDIMLFHEDYRHSVDTIGDIIQYLQLKYFSFVSVDHYFEKR